MYIKIRLNLIDKLNWKCASLEPCNISDYGIVRGIEGFDHDMAVNIFKLINKGKN